MDEQMIARALCKACGRDPDALLNGVPEWVARQVEARAAHSVMAGKVAELTQALRDARGGFEAVQDIFREIRGRRSGAIERQIERIDAALAPHPKPENQQ